MRPGRRRFVRQWAVLTAAALAVALAGAWGVQASAFPQGAEDPLPRIKALRGEGRLDEALAVATEALGREPGRRDLRMERGFLLGSLGRYDEALADYEAVLAGNPGDTEALLEHAQVRTLQGKYDEAEGEFRFILNLAPGVPGASFGLGDVLTWKQDLAGARAAYLDYVRARPDDPRGHLRLGDVAVLAGDAKEARAQFQEALRLDPGNAEAQAALVRADRLAAREYRFRLDLGGTYETLTRGQPDWREGAMLLTFRPRQGTEISAGAQAYNRFGESDQLVSLGFSQSFFTYITLSGDFGRGLNGRFLPKELYEGQLAIPAGPRLQLFTSYSFLHFNGNITAETLSPGAQVSLPWGFTFLGRYFRTTSTGNEPANAYLLQLSHETTERFQPYLGVSRGGLGAGARTTAELLFANSQFTSFFTGFSWRLLAHFGIKADYAVQRVKEVYTKYSFGLATFFEF